MTEPTRRERRAGTDNALRPGRCRVFENAQDFAGRRGGAEPFAHPAIVKEFRNRRQRPEMRLKLVFWDNKEDDETDGRIVE